MPSSEPRVQRSCGPAPVEELTLRIAERAHRIAQQREMAPGGELALWLQAQAEVKRELKDIASVRP